MQPPEAIGAGLPPPHEGEPPDLREDIVDEISDHLRCAMDRERRRATEPAARAAVIDRFGDPARLARRLWFEAMKETAMQQRTALITNVALAIMCVTVCLFVLTAVRRNADLNAAMLEKLETIGASAAGGAPTMDWPEARVRVVGAGGSPAEGFHVALVGRPFNGAAEHPSTIDRTTDAEGHVRFGPVRPGSYTLKTVDTRDREQSQPVILYPGRVNEFDVAWPAFSEARVPVTVNVEIAEALAPLVAYYEMTFARRPLVNGEPGRGWTFPRQTLLVRPDARLTVLDETGPDWLTPFVRGSSPLVSAVEAAALDFTDSIAVPPDVLYEIESLAAYVEIETAGGPDLTALRMEARQRRQVGGQGSFKPPPPFSARATTGTAWSIRVPKELETRVRNSDR